MSKKFLKGLIENVEKAEDGILSVAIATDNTVDRDGESIDPMGLQIDNFMRNPVLLWAHDYRSEPIGKVLEIQNSGNRVTFRPKFAIEHSEKARQIFGMFKDGFLNAFSIGFIPKERVGTVFTKAELLEISAVPVPANPNALVVARSKGYDPEIIKEIEDLNKKDDEIAELKRQLQEYKDAETKPNCVMPDGTPGHMQPNDEGAMVCMPKKGEGDQCEMPDGSMGEMHMNDDGMMVCMPKKEWVRARIKYFENILDVLRKSIGESAKDGAEHRGSVRSRSEDELSRIKTDIKRLLTTVDISVGKALQEFKSIDKK